MASGFTLVELLVVVSIIALLIALLLPSLNKVRSVTEAVKCASNLKQVGIGQLAYLNDNRFYFPIVNRPADYPASHRYEAYWTYHIGRYLYSGSATGYGVSSSVFSEDRLHCPFQAARANITSSGWARYGMNYALGPNNHFPYWRQIEDLKQPADTIMNTAGDVADTGQAIAELNRTRLRDNNWHDNRGNNILWVDGHVSFWDDVNRLAYMSSPHTVGGPLDKWAGGFDPTQP